MDWPSTWNSWSLVRTVQIVLPECCTGGWICSRKEKSRRLRVAQWWGDDWIRTRWLTSIIKVDIRVRSGLHTLQGWSTRKCPKKLPKSVVKACKTCRSIDPAPVRWKKGGLSVMDNWKRLAMDITHHNGENYLSSTAAPLDLQYGDHCADKTRPLLSDSWRMFSSSEAHRWKYWLIMTLHSQAKTFENSWGNGTCICGFGVPTHRVETELWKEVIGPLRLSQLEKIVQ